MEIFEVLNNVPYLYEVLQGLIAAHALALFVVNLTDTPKDNELLSKSYRYVEFLAGIVRPAKVKQVGPADAKRV